MGYNDSIFPIRFGDKVLDKTTGLVVEVWSPDVSYEGKIFLKEPNGQIIWRDPSELAKEWWV